MAEDRMIRASMRWSENVNSWPIELRYFWTQLWGYCDDFGRGRDILALIKADTFPLDDDVTAERVGRWMQALELAGVVHRYEVGGKRFFECVNWHEHQEPQYLRKTDIPDSSGEIPTPGKRSRKVQNIPESSVRREEKRREVEGEENAPAALTPFCEKHPSGTDKPCRACGNRRRAYEAGRLAEKSKPTPLPPRSDEVAAHRHKWVADGTCTYPGCFERKQEVA